MMTTRHGATILGLLAACGRSEPPVEPAAEDTVVDRTITLAPPASGYQLVTEPYEVAPFTEAGLCTVIRLEPSGDETFAWVNRFESLVSEHTHHMNVFIGQFSFLDGFVGEGAAENALGVPVGQYPCADLTVMEAAFPVFPSQRQNQQIVFPPGVAAPMTAPLMLIFSHHYINTEDTPVLINAALNVETIPGSEVEHVAGLVFDAIGGMAIPSGERQVRQRTCIFERDATVALVSTHNHAWTECATLHHYDGATETIEADPFFVNQLWDQPPILHFEPDAFTVSAGDGVHYACHYANDTPDTLINDGTADGEMCVFAAVTYPLPWTVAEVETVMGGGDLTGLLTLMDDALGSCDSGREDLPGPWSSEPRPMDGTTSTCADLGQTESNVLGD